MKYLIAILCLLFALPALASDDQPSSSELRKKSTTQLREMIEEAYAEIKDTNQKFVESENKLSLTEMSLEKSKENYADLYNNHYLVQLKRGNEFEDKFFKAQLKIKAIEKSNFILKSFMAVAVAIIVFIVMANFMSWASFPLNWIGPFVGAAAAAAFIFFIF